MPFFDADTNVLFLAGKGDGNIRYYEIVDEDPYIHWLSEFKSATPQRGACVIPKRYCDISSNEVVRILKLGVRIMEPISFEVPRKVPAASSPLPVAVSHFSSLRAVGRLPRRSLPRHCQR